MHSATFDILRWYNIFLTNGFTNGPDISRNACTISHWKKRKIRAAKVCSCELDKDVVCCADKSNSKAENF